jgi:putative exporter of polyketide antibiotics
MTRGRSAEIGEIELDGLEIAYRRAGEGPPLLLLHGGPTDSWEWRGQIEGPCDEFTWWRGTGLTILLTRPVVAAWLVALSVTGLVFGLVAQAAGAGIHGARGLKEAIRRLGATAPGAQSYLGFVFVVAAVLMSVAVAGQIAGVRNDEASGHLENLLVRPVARWRWLGVRLAAAIGFVVGGGALAGFTAWIGALSEQRTSSSQRLSGPG